MVGFELEFRKFPNLMEEVRKEEAIGTLERRVKESEILVENMVSLGEHPSEVANIFRITSCRGNGRDNG